MNNKNSKIKLKNILLILTTMLTTTAIIPLTACSGSKDETKPPASNAKAVCNDKPVSNCYDFNQNEFDTIFGAAKINYPKFKYENNEYKLELNQNGATAAHIFLISETADTTSKAKTPKMADFIEFYLRVKPTTGEGENREFSVNDLKNFTLDSSKPTITFTVESESKITGVGKVGFKFVNNDWHSMTFTTTIDSQKFNALIQTEVTTQWRQITPNWEAIKQKEIRQIETTEIVTSASRFDKLLQFLNLELNQSSQQYTATDNNGGAKQNTAKLVPGDRLKIDKYKIGDYVLPEIEKTVT